MPRASVASAAAVKPGERRSDCAAWRMSFQIASSMWAADIKRRASASVDVSRRPAGNSGIAVLLWLGLVFAGGTRPFPGGTPTGGLQSVLERHPASTRCPPQGPAFTRAESRKALQTHGNPARHIACLLMGQVNRDRPKEGS